MKGIAQTLALTVSCTSGFKVYLLPETVIGSSCKTKFWLYIDISPILHVPMQFVFYLIFSKNNTFY